MDRSFGSWFCNLGKLVIIDVIIALTKDNLPGLGNNLPSNAVYKFERKIIGQGAMKEFILINLNEDMNGIIKFIKTLENLGVLIDRAAPNNADRILKNATTFVSLMMIIIMWIMFFLLSKTQNYMLQF